MALPFPAVLPDSSLKKSIKNIGLGSYPKKIFQK
jgi:hypothetical protein